MRDGSFVVVHVEGRQHALCWQIRLLDQQCGQVLDAAMEPIYFSVDLDPVAGREHERLSDVGRQQSPC